MAETSDDKAKRGYEALYQYTGGENLFHGALMPEWGSLTRIQRDAVKYFVEAVAEPESKKK